MPTNDLTAPWLAAARTRARASLRAIPTYHALLTTTHHVDFTSQIRVATCAYRRVCLSPRVPRSEWQRSSQAAHFGWLPEA